MKQVTFVGGFAASDSPRHPLYSHHPALTSDSHRRKPVTSLLTSIPQHS
jgi:hypothetical protein